MSRFSSLLRFGASSSSRCVSRLIGSPALLRSPLPRSASIGSLLIQGPARSFALLTAAGPLQHRCCSSPIAAAVVGQPALVAAAAPLAATQQVRHKKGNRGVRPGRPRSRGGPHAGRGNYVWWQPLLPAMAAERVPDMKGKGRKLKLNQIRRQQVIWNHAIRKEGVRRNKIFKMVKREKESEKVMEVYRQYGEILRQRALAAQEAGGADAHERGVDLSGKLVDDWRPDLTSPLGRKLPARTRGWAGGTGRESRWGGKGPAETAGTAETADAP